MNNIWAHINILMDICKNNIPRYVGCPLIKSIVDYHNVCFLGWGLVSLKKRGCLATCNT